MQKQKFKYVGLQNTGNLCYLNSTMQVIFNLPKFCDEMLEFFDSLSPEEKSEFNDTTKSFVKILKEKKEINEGKEQKTMDLSHLRKSFNIDLEKRHRDHDKTFGMDQNDSSEFYLFLFEFLLKYKKDQDKKALDRLLGVFKSSKKSDTIPEQIERCIKKGNFTVTQEMLDYFINESNSKFKEEPENIKKNPIFKYFYDSKLQITLGPCPGCKEYIKSYQDFSILELDCSRLGWGATELQDLIDSYFQPDPIKSRCQNMKCSNHPINIMRNREHKKIYYSMDKSYKITKLPKLFKILFKRYTYDRFGYGGFGSFGRKIDGKITLPICLTKDYFKDYHLDI